MTGRHTDRQSTLVVRTDGPVLDPAWTVSDLGLEDLVLSYMDRAPPTSPHRRRPRPALEVLR